MATKQVFNRHRHNVPSLLDTRTEGESLKDTMTELATFYKLVQIHGAQDSVVCDLSSNNLTFDHARSANGFVRTRSNCMLWTFHSIVLSKSNGHQSWNLYEGFQNLQSW